MKNTINDSESSLIDDETKEVKNKKLNKKWKKASIVFIFLSIIFGACIVLSIYIIKKQYNENQELRSEIKNLNVTIIEQEEIIHQLNQTIIEQEGIIEELNETIAEQNLKINKLNDIIDNLNKTIEDLKNQIKDKDKTIEDLNNEINEKNIRIENLENEINEKNRRIDDLNNQIREKDNRINQLQNEVNEKNNKINQLNDEIRQLNDRLNAIIYKYSIKYNGISDEMASHIRYLVGEAVSRYGDYKDRCTYISHQMEEKYNLHRWSTIAIKTGGFNVWHPTNVYYEYSYDNTKWAIYLGGNVK